MGGGACVEFLTEVPIYVEVDIKLDMNTNIKDIKVNINTRDTYNIKALGYQDGCQFEATLKLSLTEEEIKDAIKSLYESKKGQKIRERLLEEMKEYGESEFIGQYYYNLLLNDKIWGGYIRGNIKDVKSFKTESEHIGNIGFRVYAYELGDFIFSNVIEDIEIKKEDPEAFNIAYEDGMMEDDDLN